MATSPTSGPGGGSSYSPPTECGVYVADTAGGTLIANNATAPLDWDLISGDALLDLTDNTIPTVLADGIYSVAAAVGQSDDMTVGGFYEITLVLDTDGLSDGPIVDSRLATAARPRPLVAISGTAFIPAGSGLRINCRNRDGAAAIHFGLSDTLVQRVT